MDSWGEHFDQINTARAVSMSAARVEPHPAEQCSWLHPLFPLPGHRGPWAGAVCAKSDVLAAGQGRGHHHRDGPHRAVPHAPAVHPGEAPDGQMGCSPALCLEQLADQVLCLPRQALKGTDGTSSARTLEFLKLASVLRPSQARLPNVGRWFGLW